MISFGNNKKKNRQSSRVISLSLSLDIIRYKLVPSNRNNADFFLLLDLILYIYIEEEEEREKKSQKVKHIYIIDGVNFSIPHVLDVYYRYMLYAAQCTCAKKRSNRIFIYSLCTTTETGGDREQRAEEDLDI